MSGATIETPCTIPKACVVASCAPRRWPCGLAAEAEARGCSGAPHACRNSGSRSRACLEAVGWPREHMAHPCTRTRVCVHACLNLRHETEHSRRHSAYTQAITLAPAHAHTTCAERVFECAGELPSSRLPLPALSSSRRPALFLSPCSRYRRAGEGI